MTDPLFSPADQETVARAWAEAAGLAGLELSVHPSDEMLAFIAAGSPRYDAHRFEYLRSGQEAFAVVQHVVAQCGRQLSTATNLLDLPSGCGRVTRFFVRELGRERVVASEIDDEALAFVGRTFGVSTAQSVGDPAQLRLDRRFDVVFVGSLFSHLPRQRFVAWLRRLGEALADDGLLVFTTHGANVRGDRAADASGFTFVPISETTRLPGDEYGSAFVEPELVVELAGQAGLSIVGFVERELWNLQDVFVARRGSGGTPARLPSAPIIYGRIERAFLPRPGHAWIGGGTRVVARLAPLCEVRILVDGKDIAAATLGTPATHAGPSRQEVRVTTEWYTEGDATFLSPGLHTICAQGEAASGQRDVFGARGLWVGEP